MPTIRKKPTLRFASSPSRYVVETAGPYDVSVVGLAIQADCTAFLPQVAGGIYDTIYADPPFNIGYMYDKYDDGIPASEYLSWCSDWLGHYHRLLSDDGTLWLAIGPKSYPDLDLLARNRGFHRRSTVIWHYTFGVANTRNFSLGYTNLAYYTKHRTRFHFDPDICRVPSARQLVYADKRANPRGKLPDDVWFYRPQDLPGGLPADGDVWHCPRVAGTFRSRHAVPTQMPEQVVARCILMTTPPRGLVGDFMAGSGTTPAVCKKLGFRYTACELSEDYAAKMALRLDHVKEGDPLDGPSIQP